jgi:hypothetical protein
VAAHGSGSALLKMTHDLVLFGAQAVVGAVLFEMATENLRHLGPIFSRNDLNRGSWIMHDALLQFERAFDLGDTVRGEVQVSERGFDVDVAKQALQDKDIGALIELVGGKAVAQGMDAPPPGHSGFFFAA